ncbi:TrmH family RNA methyltransferase [Candidatus Saccharibacteria bacterium]|nr:TrmH family RNA methyltransferase [Candidatus Saccharibacteria bacterium]
MILVLHNIRSVYNVGAILRTAEGFGVDKVICSGYTPYVSRPGILPHVAEKLEKQISKSAVGAEKLIEINWCDDIVKFLEDFSGKVVGLENNLPKTVALSEAKKLLNDKDFALVLGEEVKGIPEEVRKVCDFFVEIPMRGQKESFNVSVAAGIAMYELNS